MKAAQDKEAAEGYARTLAAWPAEMMRPLGKIPRFENNPRLNEAAAADVMESLRRFGARQPIVVWKRDGTLGKGDGKIIVGDTRWLAAERLGWPAFPVHEMDCSEADAIAYRLADNKTGERAEWDFPKLKTEFERLQGMGVPLEASGFREFEWEPILNSEWTPPEKEPLPEGAQEDDVKRVVAFDELGWDRVLRAVERMRAENARPDWSMAECLTRLCIAYLDQ